MGLTDTHIDSTFKYDYYDHNNNELLLKSRQYNRYAMNDYMSLQNFLQDMSLEILVIKMLILIGPLSKVMFWRSKEHQSYNKT